jgi:hypothetical protein
MIQQQTPVWCWLACAEMVVRWKNSGAGPRQCELASAANNGPSPVCCYPQNPMVMQACMRTGGLPEIQALIGFFGHSASAITPPGSPIDLYQALAQRKAVIAALMSTPFSGHVVVIRGMDPNAPTPGGVIFVNDPMSQFTQPVPFTLFLQQHWNAAIVVA